MLASLFGSLCVLCRQSVTGHQARLQLCQHCLAALPWHDAQEAPGYDGIARVIAPLGYEGATRAWVLAAKRDSGLVAARVLGTLLAEAVQDAYPVNEPRPDLLIPVPLALRRLMLRGHNQAVLIAAPVSRALKIPLDRRVARRIRHTPIQPGRTLRMRAVNVEKAFIARRRFDGLTLAIVDDVVTTGATAQALADALHAAGAREIHLWCPTRTGPAATLPPS
jgi:ComF family protein